jgi:hypothetical protein
MRCSILSAILTLSLQAADGLPPRGSPAEYPVHADAASVIIGGERVRPDRVAKLFSPDIGKNYVVIEIGVYPQNGATIDLRRLDFSLRFADQQETYPDTPEEAPLPWHERDGIKDKAQVTSEAGVVVSSTKDPATGRRTTAVATYEATGVAVGNPPPDHRDPDPRLLEDRLKAKALPEGKSNKAIAGYLYFPKTPKKPKDNSLDLILQSGGASIHLPFPNK